MQEFGGDWTEKKLDRLEKYLQAYLRIFTSNERARNFHRIYVDGFAGSGFRRPRGIHTETKSLFDEEEQEVLGYRRGSAERALQLSPTFHEYVFIDRDPACTAELEKLKERHANTKAAINIVTEDANDFLQDWCKRRNWQRDRAVVFLDPFGMQVEFATLEAIAKTQAIDLWLLFPIGQAVNRLLMKRQIPTDQWADRLTALFGTEEWKDEFYLYYPRTYVRKIAFEHAQKN